MSGPAVWREITKTPCEPFISKFEMEDKSSSAAPEHQHKVTHNRFRTEMMTIGGKMTYMTLAAKYIYRTSAAIAAMQVGRYAGEGPDSGSGELVRQGAAE